MKNTLLTFVIFFIIGNVNAQTVYKLYGGQGYTSNMYVLDPITMDTIKFIPDAGGYRMVHCPMYNKIYSTDGDYYISVIDVVVDELIATIDPSTELVGSYELEAIAISPDQTKVYVADESEDAIFVLNTANDSIIDAVYVENVYEIENMVISPDGLFLYAADNDYVLKISTTTLTVVASIPVNSDSHGIAMSSDGMTIYAETNGVLEIDVPSFTIIDTIDSNGYFLALNADDTKLLGVRESSDLDVTELSTGLITNVDLGTGSARGIISHPDNSTYFVASSAGMYKVDAATNTVTGNSVSIFFQSVIIIDAELTGLDVVVEEENNLSVYPNPVNNDLTIELNVANAGPVLISILDINGKEVKSSTFQAKQRGNNSINLDLSDLNAGVYFCRVITDDQVQSTRIVME